jgi:hypothetical protein
MLQASSCPMHAAPPRRSVAPDDELFFPMHKRVITQYSSEPGGASELHLYYGDKEISFDEPELFPFGEQLSRQSHFAAATAASWAPGCDWPRMQELLGQLVDEGILRHAEPADAMERGARHAAGERPQPLPSAQTTVARSWHDCEAITAELTGRALEPGYLELIVPIFRVSHIALDAEGRQVGEANVFPKPLRLDVPTRWRTCIYDGSRYLDAKPMNVTALKAMRTHWDQIMVALLRVREAYLRRFPKARDGFTLGDVERLSTLVLAVPTYQLMRAEGRVENGALHPALSSMFRVTDGLRMTTHQMLFVPVAEATLAPESPVTSAQIYAYAERNFSFHSAHGVCAGPQAMIEEFLGVLVDGGWTGDAAAVVLDDGVETALADLETAFDYGLRGLQAHAVLFSLWPVMTRTYAQLAAIAQAWSGARTDTVTRLATYLAAKMEILQNETLHATEEWRVNRESVYADIYAQCAAGLGRPVDHTLGEKITPRSGPEHVAAANRLRAILRRQCYPKEPMDDHEAERLVVCLMNFFVQTQAILGLACDIQHGINAILGRAAPRRPLSATDVDVHVLLQGDEARRLPHLISGLEELLGFSAGITRDRIDIRAADASVGGLREFAGMVPAMTTCDEHTTFERCI